MTIGAVVGGGILLRAVAPVLLTRWTWAFAGVILSLVMTSGYMFTRIRHSPYTGRDGGWIAPGFTNQYGQEVHVIAFVCEYPALFLGSVLLKPHSRWTVGALLHHAHCDRAVSDLLSQAADANLPLDCGDYDYLLRLGVALPREEPWYVHISFIHPRTHI